MDTASFPARATPRISGPAELLQAVPYLLGFHPVRSLVVVGLHADQLVVTARIDLPDAVLPGVLAHSLEAMARGGSSSIVAAIYHDDADPFDLHWDELVADVGQVAEEVDCELCDALFVSRGRWWSLVCSGPECCPLDGQPLPAAPSAFATAATVDGLVALPDRAALAATLDPLPAEDRAALEPAIAAAEGGAMREIRSGRDRRGRRTLRRALYSAAERSDEAGWSGAETADAVRFGAALAVPEIRDPIWLAVDERRLDGRPLWLDLARRLPAPYSLTPLFLFGWASWRAGNCTLAGLAAERILSTEADYDAAQLLLAAVANALDPRQVPKLRLAGDD
jgi:hypothetical protein